MGHTKNNLSIQYSFEYSIRNKRFTVSGIDVFHIATGGKIEIITAYLEPLDMMRQLGVIPQLMK